MLKNKISIEEANVLYSQAMKDVVDGESFKYRLGQAIYNRLAETNKELADEVHCTEFDMFHQHDLFATKILFEELVDYKMYREE